MERTYVKIIRDPQRRRPIRLLFKRSSELRRWPLTAWMGESPDFATRKEAREWIEKRPALTLINAWHEAEES